jgi:hypothetical protein
MNSTVLEKEIIEQINRLAQDEQRRVLEFAKALAQSRPTGEPGKNLLKWVGCIPAQDLKEMEQAIEEGCERVDQNEW